MEKSNFETTITISTEFSDHSLENKLLQQRNEQNENKHIVKIRHLSSTELTRVTTTLSTVSTETDSTENNVTKRLLFHRTNTTPFKAGSKFKPTVFVRNKYDDTKEMIDVLKASVNEPMSFPPIVMEQLKRHEHDPYINNVDPKFWDVFDSKQKHNLVKMLRKKLSRRLERKSREQHTAVEQAVPASKESKRSQNVSKSDNPPKSKNQEIASRLSLSAKHSMKSKKLPPIETFQALSEKNEKSHSDFSIKLEKSQLDMMTKVNETVENEMKESKEEEKSEEIVATAKDDEKTEKKEEPVKEVLIDNLDGIDKPGIFVLASNLLHLSPQILNKNSDFDKIHFKNEIHVFMSSFFIDSEVERAAILVKVIPELRAIFAARGYELYYHDCHLGTNGINDNHILNSLCLKTLKDSIRKSNLFSQNGMRFMVFFGQKFGLKVLPNYIPADIFEAVFLATKRDHDRFRRSSKFSKKPSRMLTFENSFLDNSIIETPIERINTASYERANDLNSISPAPQNYEREEPSRVSRLSDNDDSLSASKTRAKSVRKESDVKVFSLTEKQETLLDFQTSNLDKNIPKRILTPSLETFDPTILNQWYDLDKNFDTPVYVLKQISAIIPDINNRKDATKKQTAKTQWLQAKKTLLKIFEKYGKEYMNLSAVVEGEIDEFLKYYSNISEKAKNVALNQLLVIERTLCEYDLNAVNDTMLHNYFDIKTHLTPEIDTSSLVQIDRLKAEIHEIVPERSHLEYVVNWSTDTGISPSSNREHLIYIERLCKQVKEQFLKSWDFILNKQNVKKDEVSQAHIDFEAEISQHRLILNRSCFNYLGSNDLLLTLRSYIESVSSVPLVILGEQGSGKSSLLKQCVQEISNNKNLKLVLRCCGKTQLSTNLRLFLKNLCQEIDSIFSTDDKNKKQSESKNNSSDFATLKNTFANRLSQATLQNQLLIILDGIENLKNDYDENMIDWIPRELPQYVHIIISFSPLGEKGDKLNKQIMKNFGKNNIIKIESFLINKRTDASSPEINENLVRKFIENTFNKKNRNINEHLAAVLINYFKELASRSLSTLNPLFCRLLLKYFQHIFSFKSFLQLSSEAFNSNSEIYNSLNFKTILERFYQFLERKHGDVFVKRTLGYIAAYQFCGGITENELLDLLSLDDAVLTSLSADLPGNKCIPEAYWLALKSILIEFDFLLEVHNPGGYRCLVFKNTIFYESVNDRYFQQRDKSVSYYKIIVNYYLNRHEAANMVQATKQPLEHTFTISSQNHKIPNIRRLNLLAYHLSQSAPTIETVKQELMFNYLYLNAKLAFADYESLIDDFNLLIYANAEFALALQADLEIKIFLEFLGLSENALRVSSTQFYSQLVGRLNPILAAASNVERKPNAENPSEPKVDAFNFIKLLIMESKKHTTEVSENKSSCFIPHPSIMIQPGNMTCDYLKGFLTNIATYTTTHDGTKIVTFEINGICKLWDLKSLRLVKTFFKINHQVKQARFAMGNLYLIIVTKDNLIHVYNIRTEEKLLTICEYDNEVAQITLGGGPEYRYLVVCYGCKEITNWSLVDFKKIKTIDLQSSEDAAEAVSEVKIESETSILDSTGVIGSKIILSKTYYEDKIGYAFRGTRNGYLFDSKTGAQSSKYTAKFDSGLLSTVELTSEYFLLLCKLTKMRGCDIYKIELHDIKRGQLSRIISGCFNDNLLDASVNMAGSHLVGISYSNTTQSSEITFWNVESEEHRHLCLRGVIIPPNRITAIDLRFLITSSVGHFDLETKDLETKQLKIWNLAARLGQPGLKYQTYDDDGVESITILKGEQSKYALTRHLENKRLSIWDLDTIETTPNIPKLTNEVGGNVIESKISFKPSDIILVYDDINTVYILTDKGASENEEGEASPIFESIQVYNLKEQKYEYKVNNIFICAYDTNEYLIIKNNNATVSENDTVLVGLSETRNHFIIYSIKTGHIIKRMRTNFKDEKRKRVNVKSKGDNDSKFVELLSMDSFVKPRFSMAFNSSDFAGVEANNDLEHEKETKNIEQFIVSADHKTIVASYHAHHICVFDLNNFTHIQTLEDVNCLLFLYVAHLTSDGKYLIHNNYDTTNKVGYITIWDCKSGKMKRRLKNETNIVSLTMSDDANHVLFCKQNGDVKYWNPMEHGSLKNIKYDKLIKKLTFEIDTKIHLIRDNTQALILSGKTFSLWDIRNARLINVFTNDFKLMCYSIVLNETTLLLGHKTSSKPLCLRLPE